VHVGYPPDTKTPGFEEEEKTKPVRARLRANAPDMSKRSMVTLQAEHGYACFVRTKQHQRGGTCPVSTG
jgi:hypothetical protein